jgi:hypothetical protein
MTTFLLSARQILHHELKILQLELKQNLLELRLKIPRIVLVHLVKSALVSFFIFGFSSAFSYCSITFKVSLSDAKMLSSNG